MTGKISCVHFIVFSITVISLLLYDTARNLTTYCPLLSFFSPRIIYQRKTGEDLLSVLSIAHKYCMETIESDIIQELKLTSQYTGLIDLVVASRMIDSASLYEDGIDRLISSETLPTREQALRLEADATHAVMSEITKNRMELGMRGLIMQHEQTIDLLEAKHRKNFDTLQTQYQKEVDKLIISHRKEVDTLNNRHQTAKQAAVAAVDNRKCRHCNQPTNWQCQQWICRRNQV
jgi:hypothetical protein